MGRDQEVDLYKTLLDQARGYSAPHHYNIRFCNMLIIQGVHRQGKTRMLEELMFVTDSTIPLLRFNLSLAEYEVSMLLIVRGYIFEHWKSSHFRQ